MIYVQNHKVVSGKQVGKWHTRESVEISFGISPTDCGRHIIKKSDKRTTRKPKNLTPVNSCGVCYSQKDWV